MLKMADMGYHGK